MKTTFVTTTINVPKNLEAFAQDAKANEHKDVSFIVAGDLKTPHEDVISFLKNKIEILGFKAEYLGVGAQETFLENCPKYKTHLPWNCIQRRNVAILYAYRNGADVIYTLDDDNFLHTQNCISFHANLGSVTHFYAVDSAIGWFNPCGALLSTPGVKFYPRGYSFDKRGKAKDPSIEKKVSGRIVVNAGLWLGEPDIDAVTRLAIRPNVTSALDDVLPVVFGVLTKCPFNSQNTALHRNVIPAYCLATGLGRYDDIVASYVVKRIADHLNDFIRFGLPLVNQIRNEHDIYKDLEDELLGMKLIDRIVEKLYAISLTGKTYKDCAAELMKSFMLGWGFLPPDQYMFLSNIKTNYDLWLEMF